MEDFRLEMIARTQESLVLRALLAGESVTPMDALRRWGIFRLAARVFRLRQKGFPVLTRMAEMAGGKRVAVYAMAPEWLKKFREDAEACHD